MFCLRFNFISDVSPKILLNSGFQIAYRVVCEGKKKMFLGLSSLFI